MANLTNHPRIPTESVQVTKHYTFYFFQISQNSGLLGCDEILMKRRNSRRSDRTISVSSTDCSPAHSPAHSSPAPSSAQSPPFRC